MLRVFGQLLVSATAAQSTPFGATATEGRRLMKLLSL
jgi:hypothetical protein